MWVDVGINESSSDVQIVSQLQLRAGIIDGTIISPAAEPLPADDRPMPYFLIRDDAFSLRTWLMKPFSGRMLPDDQRIFNYRLSCVCRVVEKAFGIMANRFGCLLTTINQSKATSIVLAMVCIMVLWMMRINITGCTG